MLHWFLPKLNTQVNLPRLWASLHVDQAPSASGVQLLFTHCEVGTSQPASPPMETSGNQPDPLPRQPNVTSKAPPEWPSAPATPMFLQCGQQRDRTTTEPRASGSNKPMAGHPRPCELPNRTVGRRPSVWLQRLVLPKKMAATIFLMVAFFFLIGR